MVVGYPSGIGIVSHYLRVPTVMFWRPDGNSMNADLLVSFSEDMAYAWAYPSWREDKTLLSCFYGRQGVMYLLAEIAARKWLV
jgi:hypothetical protein